MPSDTDAERTAGPR